MSASGVAVTIAPADAVARAAAAPRHGVQGTFAMLVRATGKSRGHTFLNSELDYRDQQNLSIDIDIRGTKLLERQLGAPLDQFYKGKWIEVRGTARRVPIGFFDKYGRSTGKYYFQTHVPVRGPGQIKVVPPPATP
ncbi:MAG TPA: hypothetical protein VE221_02765 [Sphingomicrobium sp.]|nr:hypothetical protein [Sphingomicrobium sp.]